MRDPMLSQFHGIAFRSLSARVVRDFGAPPALVRRRLAARLALQGILAHLWTHLTDPKEVLALAGRILVLALRSALVCLGVPAPLLEALTHNLADAIPQRVTEIENQIRTPCRRPLPSVAPTATPIGVSVYGSNRIVLWCDAPKPRTATASTAR